MVFYLLIGITSAALQTASYPFTAAPYLAKMKIMKGTIAIEILGNRVKPLLSLKSPGRVVYRLTTSDDNQRMGKIRLLLLRGDKKLLIKELIVHDIPEMKAGDPDIDLQVEYIRGQPLALVLSAVGGQKQSSSVDLKAYRSKRWWIIPILLLLLLIPAILWFDPFTLSGNI